ncbi:MAG: hypothetical protein U0793_14780 [Gemmataceae bacterium]
MARVLAIALLLAGSGALAMPGQVLIIRHAEKGEDEHLSARGRERAAALAVYFLERAEVLEKGRPVAVYAQKSTMKRPSKRPVETVAPVAAALMQKVIVYSHSDYLKMVEEIKTKREYEGKTVLICWEHTAIEDVAKAFGVKETPRWRGKDFDRVWVLTFSGDGVTLRNLGQRLMFGDAAE